MRLTFLGTGAATASPLPFCRCACCTAARRLGGKNIRRRSSLLIDDTLLIDLGPDTVQAAFQFGCDLRRVHTLLVTHAHADHYDPTHLNTRMADYGCIQPDPLTLIASPASLRRMSDSHAREEAGLRLDQASGCAALRLTVQPATAGQTLSCGRYTVTALPSRHDPPVGALLYAVSDGTHCVLYATDSPAFDAEQWQALTALGRPLDCVILDHTYGALLPDLPRTDHMSAHDVARTAAALRARGLLAPQGQIWATHISHEGMPDHDALSAQAAAHGYHIAYDGLTLTL